MLFALVFSTLSAQVPSYVPTNGLVGWWPFNGNANDESGNGNNGTVNGASLSADRFGNSNKSYEFDGIDDYIKTTLIQGSITSYSISCWVKLKNGSSDKCGGAGSIVQARGPAKQTNGKTFFIHRYDLVGSSYTQIGTGINAEGMEFAKASSTNYNDNTWHHVVGVWSSTSGTNLDANQVSLYIDGKLINVSGGNYDPTGPTKSPIYSPYETLFGLFEGCTIKRYFTGLIDDIGIWNRSLSSLEVEKLYSGCQLDEITANPSDAKRYSSQNATLTTAVVSGSKIEWQSNADNLGWTNVPSNSFYSGGTTVSLTVNNVQISNHNQKFRAIATNGPCKDTSAEAKIIITDTCINTKSVSVADTLKFAVNLTGVAPPNNRNAMKVYPNPTNSAVVIDNGNFTAMANYVVKIENSIGQQVFFSKVTQQQFTVDVSTLGGKGVYTLTVLDPAGKLLETKKIVLQ